MANSLMIREVTLAQISDSTNTVNTIGAAFVADIPQSRLSAYQPFVVRVTDHPANTETEEDNADNMALFLSTRHGEPWRMTGHQEEHIVFKDAAVIADTQAYSVIYPNFDYTTFE